MLFAILCATSLGGVLTAAAYWQKRRTALAALIMLHESQGENVQPARERYWKLDKSAKYFALANLACWVVCVLVPGLIDQNAEMFPWVWQRLLIIAPPTLSMWGMVIIAEVFNSRESKQRDSWWLDYHRRHRD